MRCPHLIPNVDEIFIGNIVVIVVLHCAWPLFHKTIRIEALKVISEPVR